MADEPITTADPAAIAPEDPSLMDAAAKETADAKAADDKRILEAKDEDLTDVEKLTKADLVKAAKEAEAAEAVPEKYEFKAAEGMTLDQALVDKFIPVAKDLGLSQAKAQKLVDMYTDIVKSNEAAQANTFKNFVEELKTETIKELGVNYKQELSYAAKARDRFASTELIEKLNQSGLANDKDMVKLFIAVGKAVSEGKVIEGKSAPSGGKTAGDILFPSANK